MRVRKQCSSIGKSINVRSQCLWVSAQAAGPVVQVIDRYQKNVRAVGPVKSLYCDQTE